MRPIYNADSLPSVGGSTDSSDDVEIPVEIDNSKLEINGVDGELGDKFTIIFYPLDDSKPTTFIVDSSNPKIKVKKGDYSVIIFNGLVSNHPGLKFSDTQGYETIKVNVDGVDIDQKSYMLYVDSMDEISISEDTQKVEFKPTNIFTTVNITTYISSMDLLKNSGSYAVIDGLASGLYLYNRTQTFDDSISINMPFNLYVLDPYSTTTGYLRGHFNCCGLFKSEDDTEANTASLQFKLLDESAGYQEYVKDITGKFNCVGDQALSVDINDIKISK